MHDCEIHGEELKKIGRDLFKGKEKDPKLHAWWVQARRQLRETGLVFGIYERKRQNA